MLNSEITVGKKKISKSTRPYIIAEAGSNHNQSKATALQLIEVAAQAGADAVKFQLFRASELYPAGTSMHEVFKSIELSPDWVGDLARHCREHGVEFLASPFDRGSVDVLEAAGVSAYKVASSETTRLPLLAHIAKKGRPLFISTGMCDLVDVIEAVNVCRGAGNPAIALLQCGAMYPLPPEKANLRAMKTMQEVFGCPVGFSDHTLGSATSVAAVALGATVIEKHFTLDKKSKGPDHFYALEPQELKAFVAGCHEAFDALGSAEKEMLPAEKNEGRRNGLYAARALSKGQRLTVEDLLVQRPAKGLRERYKEIVIGSALLKDIPAGAELNWEALDLSQG